MVWYACPLWANINFYALNNTVTLYKDGCLPMRNFYWLEQLFYPTLIPKSLSKATGNLDSGGERDEASSITVCSGSGAFQ